MANVTISIVYKDGSASARKQTAKGLDDIGESADKAKPKLNAFGEVAVGALRKVGEFAVGALADAGRALIGFVGDSIGKAGDYEASMNTFAAVTGATADQMAAAKDEAKALGADLTLPATSAASAGIAMTELAKAGLSVSEAMDAAKGTLQLAAAGQLDEAKAAEISANALNTFGLAGRDATEVADLFAAAANASSIEVTDMADALKMGGGIFSGFQGSVVGPKDALIDFTTAVGELGNAGIKGSSAGTYLAQSLQQLTGPSDKAKALMGELAERIGISGDIAFDASGRMRPFKEIIDLTAKSTAGMTDEQRDFYLTTILGSEGMKAFLPLMHQGTDGWDKMRLAVTKENAAAELAAAKMQGLNGAVEGLGSQVETLMLEALEPLLPVMTAGIERASALAASFQGSVGPAVEGAIGFVSDAAEIMQATAIPAVTGLTAALITYAVVQIATAAPATVALIAKVALATEAFYAQAAATLVAIAPYAVMAVAIGAVVYAYQGFTDKVKSATQELLSSRQWWTDSAKAIEDYGTQTGAAKEKLEPYAATIRELRSEIEGEVESLGKRMAAGLVSDAQYQEEMATINAHRAGLIQVTAAYTEQEQALVRQAAAAQTGTARLAEMNQGEQQIAQQTELTAKEFEKLQKQLEKTFADGAKAVESYVNTELGFMADLDKARKEGFDKGFQEQALAYAQESAAQRAHLGEMLSDYTLTQVQMGNINKETGEKILGQIEAQFGVTQDLSARTFLAMTADIDKAAQEGGSALNSLGSDLDATAQDATATKAAMDALAKQYTAELIQNFKDGKIDADELRQSLEAIPARVTSEVTITTTRREIQDNRGDDPSQQSPGRASGGPVIQGVSYLVGEQGPEYFTPERSGSIIPNGQARAANSGERVTQQAVAVQVQVFFADGMGWLKDFIRVEAGGLIQDTGSRALIRQRVGG